MERNPQIQEVADRLAEGLPPPPEANFDLAEQATPEAPRCARCGQRPHEIADYVESVLAEMGDGEPLDLGTAAWMLMEMLRAGAVVIVGLDAILTRLCEEHGPERVEGELLSSLGEEPIVERVRALGVQRKAPSREMCDDYVREYEGTYNSRSGRFYCDGCYIAVGQPVGCAP